MEIRPIKTESEYEAALAEIDALMNAGLDTPEGDRLDLLVALVEAYESRRWAIAPIGPISDAMLATTDADAIVDTKDPLVRTGIDKLTGVAKLLDMSSAFADLKFDGVDMDAVAASQRKNLEALTAANQLAVEGMQAVARRQSEIMRQMMEEAGEAMREMMATGSPEDKAAKQTELAKSAFEQAIANMRELAELVAKSNNEAFDVINKRVAASLEEIKALSRVRRGRSLGAHGAH